MANYNVDIAVAVKNTQAITQLSNNINQTGTRVDRLNEILEKFGNNIGGTVVNSVKNFNNATKEAAENLNKTALGGREATRAAREFVRAVDLENAALREQAALLAQVRNQGKSGTLRGGTQYSGPIGPGPASSTALSSPLPARSARTTQYLSPVGPISPQQRTGRAEQIAREAALRSAANQKDFEARRTFQAELFNIEKRFENSLERQRRESDSDEFDRLLKRLDAEKTKIKQIGDLREKINQKEIEDFDKRFKQARDLRGQTSPIGGAANIPGSPAAKAAKGGGNKGFSDLALGVGFPLLFGGGAGSIAGGALGSVGGMGGQVLGSAIGQIFDTFAQGVAELGNALDPLNGDLNKVTEAAGESGTAFKTLVDQLEEATDKETALRVATEQLSVVVGSEGVKALRDYGNSTTDLNNELAKSFTALGAALAPVLTRVNNFITKEFETARLSSKGINDPRFAGNAEIQKILDNPESYALGSRGANGAGLDREARSQIADIVRTLELQKEITIAKNAQSIIDEKIKSEGLAALAAAQAKNAIIRGNNDLLDESVVAAKQAENAETVRVALLAAGTDLLKRQAAIVMGSNLFLELQNAVQAAKQAKEDKELREKEAAQRKANAAARKAAREQEARDREAKRLQQSIFNEDLKQLQIQSKINQFYQGGIEAIQTQKQELELVLNARIEQIKITTEDLTLQNEKIQTLKMQAQLELASLDRSEEQLLLAEKASALSAAAGFNVLGLANDTGAVQDRGIYGSDTGPVSFEEGINLAPLIAYQVELDKILEKYPLIGEAAGAAAGLITTGFESIIDGTKSAEEVFADFLSNIADMLMKTAQQMIAQYIAIAVAKMFAGMGSSFSGGSFSDFNGVGGNPFTTASSIPAFLGFPGRANGGPVSGGRPYTVGERGPELFVPGASGTIIPNEAMGGTNVVVNVDASGSSAQGDGQQAKQLGSAIGAAVQAELIKQKRPGGILAA